MNDCAVPADPCDDASSPVAAPQVIRMSPAHACPRACTSAAAAPVGTVRVVTPELFPGPGGGLVHAESGTGVWNLHDAGAWVLVPTNTQTKSDGTAVMGAGLALDVARRFPDVPGRYGRSLAIANTRIAIPDHRLLLGPTKSDWRRPARMTLVRELLEGVARWCLAHPGEVVAVPSPGCGRGGLPWQDVRDLAVELLGEHRVILLPPVQR